jgi:hypothetical protein
MSFRRTKVCCAESCKELIPVRLLMCAQHWAKVPKLLQEEVYAAFDYWKSGGNLKPYLEVVKRARLAVACNEALKKEGHK